MSEQETIHEVNDDTEEPFKSKWRIYIETAVLVALGFGVFLATSWAFSPSWYRVIGTSMYPNLLHGDACLIIDRYFGFEIELSRNDVVIFKDSQQDKMLVKRVVGLPGDKIEVRGNRLYVNGKEEDITRLLLAKTEGHITMTLGDDQYYVLGDNRMNSHDSRAFGPVTRDQVEGVVHLRWRHPSVP